MMKRFGMALVVVAAMGPAGAAFAYQPGANQDTGFITEVDVADDTVTLSGGATYTFSSGFNLGTFNEGQKVVITWDQVGGTAVATGMQFAS
jgi:hypothetical protein